MSHLSPPASGVFESAVSLYSRLKGSSPYYGVAAGNSGLALEEVRGFVEESTGVSTRLHEVQVDSWRLKGLGVEPRPSWSVTAPYVLSGDVEGPPVLVEGDPSIASSWRGVRAEGRVALARAPGVVDDLKAAALLAWEAGAGALLVESPRPRVIVTGGDWGYSLHAGSPTPIPVVVVPRGFALKALRKGWVRVWVDACASRSRDYSVIAEDGGQGEAVIVGAHYDHWLSGFNDNILGVAQAVAAFNRLRAMGRRAVLAVFTAEEHGAPGLASWYWAAGSREYGRLLQASGASESVGAYVNFDMAGGECLKASGAPHLALKASSLGLEHRCCECPECDSIMLAWSGVPTLSIHGLWCPGAAELYHTPDDTPDRASRETAERAVEVAVSTAASSPDWGLATAFFRSSLKEAGLRGRRILYILESIARRAGWGALIREANRRLLRVVHYGSLRWESRELEALYLPELTLLPRLRRDLESGRPPGMVVEVGRSERPLYVLNPTMSRHAPPGGSRVLFEQADQLVREAERDVEHIQRLLIA